MKPTPPQAPFSTHEAPSTRLAHLAPRTRGTDHDAYPTTPRAQLINLVNLLALDGSPTEESPASGCKAAGDRDLSLDHEGKGEGEGKLETADSGYTFQTRECAISAREMEARIRREGEVQRRFAAELKTRYVPTGAPSSSAMSLVRSWDKRPVAVEAGMSAQEREWYDDDGFLIEDKDLAADILRRGKEEGRITSMPAEQLPKLDLPTGRQGFRVWQMEMQRLEDCARRVSLSYKAPYNLRARRICDSALWAKRHHRAELTRVPRNDSQFSFDANVVEEAVVCRRDVIVAEKKRRRRQQVLGLETCNLAKEKDGLRKVMDPGNDFEASIFHSGTGNFLHEAYMHRHLVFLGCEAGTNSASLHGEQWSLAGTNKQPLGHVQYLPELLHPLAMTFGTACERAARIEHPTDAPITQEGASGVHRFVPAGYCVQCSSLHVGRLADAHDSVVEGFSEHACGTAKPMGRSGEPEVLKDEIEATEEEKQEDKEIERVWCWPFRCVGRASTLQNGPADDKRDDRRGKSWNWKPRTKRKKLYETPPGATPADRK